MSERNSRLNVPPPPRSSSSRLPDAPPTSADVPDNLSRPSDGFQDLNFKVSSDFHRRFKLTAATWGMSMKELLEASFKKWVEEHGYEPPGFDREQI